MLGCLIFYRKQSLNPFKVVSRSFDFHTNHNRLRLRLLPSESKRGGGTKTHFIMSTVPIPDGEDTVSFERHYYALKLEHEKVHPNKQVVEELMSQSFAMRWNDLHDNSYGHDTEFDKYPFLADVSEVSLSKASLLSFYVVGTTFT